MLNYNILWRKTMIVSSSIPGCCVLGIASSEMNQWHQNTTGVVII